MIFGLPLGFLLGIGMIIAGLVITRIYLVQGRGLGRGQPRRHLHPRGGHGHLLPHRHLQPPLDQATAEFYVAGGQIPWKLNGVAMFSNYASGASFLGVAGAIALFGIDKWWLALGFFAAWVVVVLVLASPLRRSGKYTVADALQERFSGPEIRLLTIIAGITIGTLYLVPQLVGAGHLFNLLVPELDYVFWVAIAGGFTAVIVVMGGMRGTSYNQAFQGIIIFGAMVLLLVLAVVMYFNWNPLEILTESDSVVTPTQVVNNDAADQILAQYPADSDG